MPAPGRIGKPAAVGYHREVSIVAQYAAGSRGSEG